MGLSSKKSKTSKVSRGKKSNKKSKHLKYSFAAQLGAFMLENLRESVVLSKKSGFSGKQILVSGVLPFLHMNITEKQFKEQLNITNDLRKKKITKICNNKKNNLNKELEKVGFNCERQSKNAVLSVNEAIINSIKNRWKYRKDGQIKLKQIMESMKWQVKNDIIPKTSVDWTKNL
jgi:hypothetical protein